jgi:hypothetical protein
MFNVLCLTPYASCNMLSYQFTPVSDGGLVYQHEIDTIKEYCRKTDNKSYFKYFVHYLTYCIPYPIY